MILGGKPSSKGMGPPEDEEMTEESPDSEGGGDEQAYAKLVIDAMKDGDDAGAASALVELVRNCK